MLTITSAVKVSYLIQSKNLLLMNTEYDEEVHYDVYLRDTSFLDELNELTASICIMRL